MKGNNGHEQNYNLLSTSGQVAQHQLKSMFSTSIWRYFVAR